MALTPASIVASIRNLDPAIFCTLHQRVVDRSLPPIIPALIDAGIVDACVGHFPYPACVLAPPASWAAATVAMGADPSRIHMVPMFLLNILNNLCFKSDPAPQALAARSGVAHAMLPVLRAFADERHQIAGSRLVWTKLMPIVVMTLRCVVISGSRVPPTARKFLLRNPVSRRAVFRLVAHALFMDDAEPPALRGPPDIHDQAVQTLAELSEWEEGFPEGSEAATCMRALLDTPVRVRRVRVHGLKKAAELNGRTGTVIADPRQGETERVAVELDVVLGEEGRQGGAKRVALKSANFDDVASSSSSSSSSGLRRLSGGEAIQPGQTIGQLYPRAILRGAVRGHVDMDMAAFAYCQLCMADGVISSYYPSTTATTTSLNGHLYGQDAVVILVRALAAELDAEAGGRRRPDAVERLIKMLDDACCRQDVFVKIGTSADRRLSDAALAQACGDGRLLTLIVRAAIRCAAHGEAVACCTWQVQRIASQAVGLKQTLRALSRDDFAALAAAEAELDGAGRGPASAGRLAALWAALRDLRAAVVNAVALKEAVKTKKKQRKEAAGPDGGASRGFCHFCMKPSLSMQKCKKCGMKYCSRECQKMDWTVGRDGRTHRAQCKLRRREQKVRAAAAAKQNVSEAQLQKYYKRQSKAADALLFSRMMDYCVLCRLRGLDPYRAIILVNCCAGKVEARTLPEALEEFADSDLVSEPSTRHILDRNLKAGSDRVSALCVTPAHPSTGDHPYEVIIKSVLHGSIDARSPQNVQVIDDFTARLKGIADLDITIPSFNGGGPLTLETIVERVGQCGLKMVMGQLREEMGRVMMAAGGMG